MLTLERTDVLLAVLPGYLTDLKASCAWPGNDFDIVLVVATEQSTQLPCCRQSLGEPVCPTICLFLAPADIHFSQSRRRVPQSAIVEAMDTCTPQIGQLQGVLEGQTDHLHPETPKECITPCPLAPTV